MTDHTIYGETDACPSCSKTCKNMAAEHGGNVLTVGGIFVICIRCGTLFVPKSRIKYLLTKEETRIIDPNSKEAQQLVEQIEKP